MLKGEQGARWLIVGPAGTGKTTLLVVLIAALAAKGMKVTIVQGLAPQGEDPLARFGECITIGQEEAALPFDWGRLLDLDAVRFEIVASAQDARPFLEGLSGAIMRRAGDGEGRVVVFDDRHGYAGTRVGDNMRKLYAEGRKHGVHVFTSAQSLGADQDYGTDSTARRNVDAIVTFRIADGNELDRVAGKGALAPFKREIANLPSPGGYIFADLGTGEVAEFRPPDQYRTLHHASSAVTP